jgi:poly-beta-1,6-N-acetyl-D-glucosamine synthase
VAVLSGTAGLFRADTLRHVAQARAAGTLPGGKGIYDEDAFTEDNELTLALKTLGYHPVSPNECQVVTEVMSTLPKLWKQRVRWQRGALENLRSYGWTKTTRAWSERCVTESSTGQLPNLKYSGHSITAGLVVTVETLWACQERGT